MKLFASTIMAAAILVMGQAAAAQVKLELGINATGSFLHDPAFEAFSSDSKVAGAIGGDIRLEVGTIADKVHVLPFVSYRFSSSEGYPYEILSTTLAINEFTAGARFRGWFTQWLGGFLQASGGVTWARMSAEINSYDYNPGAKSGMEDDATTWAVGGLVGLEARLSPAFLARRGIKRFNFGGEIGAGYTRRGDIAFDPEYTGGDEHSLPVNQSADWGELNLSGWTIQIGATVTFF